MPRLQMANLGSTSLRVPETSENFTDQNRHFADCPLHDILTFLRHRIENLHVESHILEHGENFPASNDSDFLDYLSSEHVKVTIRYYST